MNIAKLLTEYLPGSIWALRGNKYQDLDWHADNQQPKPTLEELQSFQEDFDSKEALRQWQKDIQKTDDLMTREMEQIIDWRLEDNKSVPNELLARYTVKKEKRAQKPDV